MNQYRNIVALALVAAATQVSALESSASGNAQWVCGGAGEQERIEMRSPNVGEWWQWLAEMLEADPDPGKAAGAHVSYRGKVRR